MKKIRVHASWDSPQNILDRLLMQFKTPQMNLSDVKFVFDNSYDIGVCFNYLNLEVDSSKRYYVFPHEPVWSGSHQKKFCENVTVFGFEKQLYSGNCIETVAHTFYGGRGPWVDTLDIWNYDSLIKQTFNKTKNISSCITSLNHNYGLYQDRYNLLKNILPLEFIDFYGCSVFNLKNTLQSVLKIDTVSNYKFTICIENDHHKNWVTERFYDAILNDCVPIYFGCKNLKEIYPEDAYILLEDIKDVRKIAEQLTFIENNAKEIYQSKLEGIRKIKSRYFTEYNLLNKIIHL